MSVKLNHLIVHSRDKKVSANFLSEILGLAEPTPFGFFFTVQLHKFSIAFGSVASLSGLTPITDNRMKLTGTTAAAASTLKILTDTISRLLRDLTVAEK